MYHEWIKKWEPKEGSQGMSLGGLIVVVGWLGVVLLGVAMWYFFHEKLSSYAEGWGLAAVSLMAAIGTLAVENATRTNDLIARRLHGQVCWDQLDGIFQSGDIIWARRMLPEVVYEGLRYASLLKDSPAIPNSDREKMAAKSLEVLKFFYQTGNEGAIQASGLFDRTYLYEDLETA